VLSVGRGDARATVMTAAIYTPVIAPAAAAATTAAPGADAAGARARDGLPETIHTATDPPESVQGEFKDIIDAACF